MALYRLSKSAEKRLSDIVEYTFSTYGETQADIYLESLEDTFSTLADQPRLGRACYTGYRFHHNRHVILYRATDYGIFISNIFHQKENIDSKLH